MDANVFLVVLEGVLRVNEDGIDYELKKDEAFFLKSGLHQKAVKPTDDGTSWCYVHFYNIFVKGAMEEAVCFIQTDAWLPQIPGI